MSFKINTNISALTAHNQGLITNRKLSSSLEKLSSGYKINKAADDASGMAIADNLRTQANSLSQAINNANDAIGIIQTADKAMEEQIKILDTIKVKSVQAAQDGQSLQSRKYIQGDIKKLLEELDNISNTTSFNGKKLLSGQFTNKEFQTGAFSNETTHVSIEPTNSNKIGSIRLETGDIITASGIASLVFKNINNYDYRIGDVIISTSPGTGIGELSNNINKISDTLNIRSSFIVESTSKDAVREGEIKNLRINGQYIGDMDDIKNGDSNAALINSINSISDATGVIASVDYSGKLNLRSLSGRGIEITSDSKPILYSAYPIKDDIIDSLYINEVLIDGVNKVTEGDLNGKLVQAINNKKDFTGVTASISKDGRLRLENIKVKRKIVTSQRLDSTTTIKNGMPIKAGFVKNFEIMGIKLGDFNILENDANGVLVKAINDNFDKIGLKASIEKGALKLVDIKMKYVNPKNNIFVHSLQGPIVSAQTFNALTTNDFNYGRLTFMGSTGKDILISSSGSSDVGYSGNPASANLNLRSMVEGFSSDIASAAGANSNKEKTINTKFGLGVGVSTLVGSMVSMELAQSAMIKLDSIRANLGSAQEQLVSNINNIAVTEINLKSGESQIRDLDFAEESSNLTKNNILSKSGNFALSQSNAIQNNILKLLQ